VAALAISMPVLAGTPAFTPHNDFAAGPAPIDVAVADLNGDGNPDMAVANDGSNTISVLMGDGAGGFAPKIDFTVGAGPHSVAIADLNSDGTLDLAVSNYQSNTVSILLNDGHGHFGARSDVGTGTAPFSVAVGDLNGDGRLDLVVPSPPEPTTWWVAAHPRWSSAISMRTGIWTSRSRSSSHPKSVFCWATAVADCRRFNSTPSDRIPGRWERPT
jgi:hypothetical protein